MQRLPTPRSLRHQDQASGKAVFGGIWLDHDRIVAVQPRPSFLPFFEEKRLRTEEYAGVNDGNDGGRARD